MTLLDLGCGPATITAGLAAAVAPGPVTGVDLEPPEHVDGVTLVRADAADLPFPDGSFDAIFACALLQHVPDPPAVLREARRVARPGAVIGLADADWGGMLLAPTDPVLLASYPLLEKMRTGSPYIGRDLRGLLADAGFQDCEASATATYHGTADEVRAFASFNASWFRTPAIVDRMVAQGFATADQLGATNEAWLAWGERPGAFFAGFWCEAIGWAP